MTTFQETIKEILGNALNKSAQIRDYATKENAKYRLNCALNNNYNDINRYEKSIIEMQNVVKHNAIKYAYVANSDLFSINDILEVILNLINTVEKENFRLAIFHSKYQKGIFLGRNIYDLKKAKEDFHNINKLYFDEIAFLIDIPKDYEILTIIDKNKGLISSNDLFDNRFSYVKDFLNYVTDYQVNKVIYKLNYNPLNITREELQNLMVDFLNERKELQR